MDRFRDITEDQIIEDWYKFAIEQPGSIDSLLRILRERLGKSLADQQQEFGVGDSNFLRLRALKLPPIQTFKANIHKIAIECKLEKPFVFLSAMLLAQKQSESSLQEDERFFYKAAFDERNDLDDVPDQEA